MSFIEFFSQPLWYRLGLTLTHFLWQGLVVVILISTFVRLFRLRAGNARYYAYLLAFVLLAICPVITFIVIDASLKPATKVTMTGTEHRADLGAYSRPATNIHEASLEREADVARVNTTQSSIPLRQRISSSLESLLPWAIVGWIIGVVSLSMRLLLGFVGVCRWRRNLKPLPENLAQRVTLLCKRLGMRHSSRVFISPLALQAMAAGYLRPLVLLPASMVTQMQPEMLEAVIAHELAHIRRLDLWINLAQRVIETLLFYHPAVWWLSRQLRSERELCCDELAITATGERLTYASALESADRARFKTEQPALSLTFRQHRNSTLGRVRHILGLPPALPDSRFWIAGVIAAVVLIILTMPITSVLTAREEAKANITSLHEAVATGDIERVKSLISEGADVNAKDAKGNTPLHLVAKYGFTKQDIAELLIVRGADVNARNKDGWTPLHFTAWRSYTGHQNIAELLIAKNVDTNASDRDGCIPLHYAAAAGSKEMIQLLLANGSDINSRDKKGWTALYQAIDWAKGDGIEILLAKGADINAKDNNDRTPLHHAAMRRNNNLTKMIIDGGANVSARDSDGCTPLHVAALRGAGEIVNTLLARGAEVDAKTNNGATPLHYAAYDGRSSVVRILLAKGADVNAKTNAGDTPASSALLADHRDIFDLLTAKGGDMPTVNSLFSVVKSGNLPEAKSLIEKGADMNAMDWRGWTALHYTARAGNKDMIQLLVSRGAKVNVQNKEGLTPLHLATDRNCAETLIAQNADVNIEDNDGWAPLHCAARDGRQEMAEILISAGANVNPTNICRKPLHWAVMKGHTSIVKLLIEKGADVNADDCHSDAPLHYAVWGEPNKEAAILLLDNGANPDSRDNASWAPLHYAAVYGHTDMADVLITKGADINLNTGWSGTPLSLAKNKGHTEIVELLKKHGAKE
jgi:ankyrin repeat protein/beta-lactamase regulating signal transducer with metallopeptidase domain